MWLRCGIMSAMSTSSLEECGLHTPCACLGSMSFLQAHKCVLKFLLKSEAVEDKSFIPETGNMLDLASGP